jgi:hypothetical protein
MQPHLAVMHLFEQLVGSLYNIKIYYKFKYKNSILITNIMDNNQRLHLQKMISANNVEDTTALIQNLKHSVILRENVNNLLMLKSKYSDSPENLHLEGMVECNFLFTYYTDIYNKIRKDEIDLNILFKAFDVLKDIEDGKIDQHEGAFKFGTLLKEIYVDSALKKAEKLDALAENTAPEYKGPQVKMTWAQFKKLTGKR